MPDPVQKTTPAARLVAAADALLAAYRDHYSKPATGGIRANAPLRTEMGELKIAADAAREAANGR